MSKSGDLILKGLQGEVGNLNKKLKGTHKITTELTSAFRLFGSVLAIRGIWNWTKEWVMLSAEMDKANRLLMQASFNAGKFTGEVHKNSIALARHQQTLSGFHRSIIMGGMKIITTFDEITNDLLPRATQAMLDYAAFTGVNMFSAAKAIGKASMGLLGDLKRVGAQVRESTYDAEGFIGILKELEVQMSGQAAMMMRSFAGSWLTVKNLIKDVKIELGDFINTLLIRTGALDIFTNHLKDVANYLNDISDTDIESFLTKAGSVFRFVVTILAATFENIVKGVNIAVTVLSGALKAMDIFLPKFETLVTSIEGLKSFLSPTAQLKNLYNWAKGSTPTVDKALSEGLYGTSRMGPVQDPNLFGGVTNTLDLIPGLLAELTGSMDALLVKIDDWLKEEKKLKSRYDIWGTLAGMGATRASMIQGAGLGLSHLQPMSGADMLGGFGGLKFDKPPIPEADLAASLEDERIRNIWKEYAKSMTKTFESAWVKMLSTGEVNFESFFISLNATMATALLKQSFYNTSGNLTTTGKWGMAGMAAYGASQSNTPIQGGITGAMAGGQIAGPPGALAGGVMGAFAGLRTTEGEKRPNISLLWDVIEGEVKLIGEQWKDSARSQELIDSIQSSLQGQIDFAKQINFLIQDRYTGLESVAFADRFGQSGQVIDTRKEKIMFAFENWEKLAKVFGQELIDFLMAEGGLIRVFEGLEERYQELIDFVSDSMGNAFLNSLETGDFDTFKQTLKEGLYETTVQGMTQAFIDRQLFSAFEGLFDVNAINTGISQYGAGNISGNELVNIISTTFADLPEVLDRLEPIWEALSTGMTALQLSLDINTDANYAGIESLRDYINTIQDTIHSLTVSDLAPALSQKVFAAEYERLQGGAGTQEGLDDFVRYIQSEYLPFMRDYATDYAGSFEKVIEDLRALEEEPKDDIVDVLNKIYENLGGDSNSLVAILKELQITGVHINEADLEKLGLTIKDGVIVALTNLEIAQAKVASGEWGPIIDRPWVVGMDKGVLVFIDSYTHEVMGQVSDYT